MRGLSLRRHGLNLSASQFQNLGSFKINLFLLLCVVSMINILTDTSSLFLFKQVNRHQLIWLQFQMLYCLALLIVTKY